LKQGAYWLKENIPLTNAPVLFNETRVAYYAGSLSSNSILLNDRRVTAYRSELSNEFGNTIDTKQSLQSEKMSNHLENYEYIVLVTKGKELILLESQFILIKSFSDRKDRRPF